MFQLLLKGCTIEAEVAYSCRTRTSFSCCWKDVRLKLRGLREYDHILRFSCCWKDVRLKPGNTFLAETIPSFSCCWKDVRLKLKNAVLLIAGGFTVSVVVERMYDWSYERRLLSLLFVWFQLLLKGCTIEAWNSTLLLMCALRFSCCWKDVRLKRTNRRISGRPGWFQLLLKGCTIEAIVSMTMCLDIIVSVVVERMYDWSSETNWLKTNDFWQLVSDLFFENGRSAQKAPLFSKIWGDLGDCLTVFDSCSNI